MYVITGATGNTGAVVAQQLLAAGKPLRVIVRDASKARALAQQGAEVVVADLQDQSKLERAFAGAEGVYLMSPPDRQARDIVAERKQLTQAVVDTLARAQVKHVVLLSSIAAQHTSGTGQIMTLHNAEQQLRASGLDATFIRPGYFVESWARFLPVVRQEGVLPVFFPVDQAIPMLAAKDVGVMAARALLDGARGNRIVELAGPKEVTALEVAASLSEVLARGVTAKQAPLEALVETFMRAGTSENIAQNYYQMYKCIADGGFRFEGIHEAARGTTSITEAVRALI